MHTFTMMNRSHDAIITKINKNYLSQRRALCGMVNVTDAVTLTQQTKVNNMNANTTVEVDTRPSAGAEAVTTNLTIDWADMSPEDVQALAQQALVVKLQGKWRKDGIP